MCAALVPLSILGLYSTAVKIPLFLLLLAMLIATMSSAVLSTATASLVLFCVSSDNLCFGDPSIDALLAGSST
jgi:hypothetical protein